MQSNLDARLAPTRVARPSGYLPTEVIGSCNRGGTPNGTDRKMRNTKLELNPSGF